VALGEAIVQLLGDDERRAEMGRIGRERITGPLSWDVSARALLEAYADAVTRRHPTDNSSQSTASD
jgi:glycosyltransferase involved in cell wall biosynthesis